jgi:anti-sigma regulatory factor (Ser/Thr protein kinase)
MERQEYRLPHTAEAPALARRLVEEHLAPLLPEERADGLVLMTSELVANAVRHSPPVADGTHQLVFECDDVAIRVGVTDGGRHLDADDIAFDTRADGHFGMYIIDRHADGWGFSLDGVKGVWFEVGL